MTRAILLLCTVALAAAACTTAGAEPHRAGASSPAPLATTIAPAVTTSPPTPTPTPTPTPSSAPTRTSPPAAAPAYSAAVSRVTAADLPHSYRAGCPVGPDQLRLVRLRYWGFDASAHTGSVVVNARVAGAVVRIFHRLYDARFPIRRLEPVDAYAGSDDRSMAADNTSAFNCRWAVAPGPHRWSVHAYGEAIDVDPVENPYIEGGQVRPPSGAAYVDRSRLRPGMAYRGGVLVAAFAAEGWQWGGRWSASPDYQHFSATGG